MKKLISVGKDAKIFYSQVPHVVKKDSSHFSIVAPARSMCDPSVGVELNEWSDGELIGVRRLPSTFRAKHMKTKIEKIVWNKASISVGINVLELVGIAFVVD